MFLFGVIDNLVLWACLMAGLEFSDYVPVPRKYRCTAVGATIAALVGNAQDNAFFPLEQVCLSHGSFLEKRVKFEANIFGRSKKRPERASGPEL